MQDKTYIQLLFSLLITVSATSQPVRAVQDPGLNGQLKRMVDQQWNDWKPDPTWKFFGTIPRDPTGALMWGILNRSYWKGQDKRSYKPGGEFQQNLSALLLEREAAKKISDSVAVVRNQELATLANMAGGSADQPYQLYFKQKFSKLSEEFSQAYNSVALYSPIAFQKMQQAAVYKNYLEKYDVLMDRIENIHSGLLEKGARTEAYFNILRQFHSLVDLSKAYCSLYIHTDKKAQLYLKKKQFELNRTDSLANNDKAIVEKILITTKF